MKKQTKAKRVKSHLLTDPKRVIKPHNTDSLMRSIWLSLVRDFRRNLNDDTFLRRNEQSFSSYKEFREEPFPSKWCVEPYRFKCMYQMENLFKRYIDSSVSSKQLETDCLQSFADFQSELRPPEISSVTYLVLRKARSIIKSILGEFSITELNQNVRFGKRANVGVPYSNSYLDVKMETLTGSCDHKEWFNQYLAEDDLLRHICTGKSYKHALSSTPIDCLTATAVPKSWKSHRIVMPDTVLGACYSAALGDMVSDRLAKVGLNIRYLQSRHARIVRKASEHMKVVTLDMSKASDLFTAELVNRLLPRKWYNAAKFGRISNVKVGDQTLHLRSFMAMGIGFTFPLQTLMFYAVLKSIALLVGKKGRISVYGDDCIYPTSMHKYVLSIFPKIGFRINQDKTFSDLPFRESCGEDSYKGVDVRPFQPELEFSGDMNTTCYRTLCYKLLNGLLRRWDVSEIPTTVLYLLKEILSVDATLKLVPNHFPDTSGLHFTFGSTSLTKLLGLWGLTWHFPISAPVWDAQFQCYRFCFWTEVAKDRYVQRISPYYWESLRILSKGDLQSWSVYDRIQDSHLVRWIKPRDLGRRKNMSYTGINGMRHTHLDPIVARKGTTRTLLQTGSFS